MRTTTGLAIVLLVVGLTLPATAAVGPGAGDSDGIQPAAAGGDSGIAQVTVTTTAEECEFPFTATDATGTEVTIDEPPERVTTTNPSAAQTMWEIGGKDQVVGLTQFALYLDGAETRTNVSAAGFGVSVEKVVGTNPDLVLVPNATSQGTVEALRDAGLTVFHFERATTIEDVRQKTALIGRLTGNCEGAAKANAWMTANVQAAREATSDEEDVRALYPLGGGYIAGTDTFISAMLNASGATNVAGERDLGGYPQVSDEVILELDPEYLVLTDFTGYLLSTAPYNQTTAVQEGNTVTVNTNWMNQPAPRSVVYAVRNLTRGFHPDAAANAAFVSRSEVKVVTPTPTTTTTAAVDDTPPETTETTETTTTGAGLGMLLAVLALITSGLLAIRRQ